MDILPIAAIVVLGYIAGRFQIVIGVSIIFFLVLIGMTFLHQIK